jgi:hypothetical protein
VPPVEGKLSNGPLRKLGFVEAVEHYHEERKIHKNDDRRDDG